MTFSEESWRESAIKSLKEKLGKVKDSATGSLYGLLSATTLWPAVIASQTGDLGAVLIALGSIASGLGANLISNQLQKMSDEVEAPEQLAAVAATDTNFRDALDTLLEKFGVIETAVESLNEDQREWFIQRLNSNLEKLGNSERFSAVLNAPGTVAQGDHSQAASEGSINIGGDVKEGGVVITGSGNKADVRIRNYVVAESDGAENRRNTVEQARVTYLEHITKTCQHLPLAALGKEKDDEEALTLSDIYITLNTQSYANEHSRSGKGTELSGEEGSRKPLSALQAAAKSRKMVLLGDPGSGKSTFVKNLAVKVATAALQSGRGAPDGFESNTIPVFLILRDFTPRLQHVGLQGLTSLQLESLLVGLFEEEIRRNLVECKAADFAEELFLVLKGGNHLVVLDGLDEVPQNIRPLIRRMVSALLKSYRLTRVIITCRIRSYDEEQGFSKFVTHRLAPFSTEQQRDFVNTWYEAQQQPDGPFTRTQVEQKSQNLRAALGNLSEKLTSNPMMLTTISIIHQSDVGLPEEKVKLFRRGVEVLLVRWQRGKEDDSAQLHESVRKLLRDESRLVAVLERLAYETHRSGADKDQTSDLDRRTIVNILEEDDYLGTFAAAEDFLDYVDKRSGLLVGRGGTLEKPDVYSFPHRVFQEYLTGCYLIGKFDPEEKFRELSREGDYWTVSALLGVEDLFYNQPNNERNRRFLLQLAYSLCPTHKRQAQKNARGLLWSAAISQLFGIEQIEKDGSESSKQGKKYVKRMRENLEEIMRSELPAQDRAEAGRYLNYFMPIQPGKTTVEAMEFCYVAGGPFWMGSADSEKMALNNEKPLCENHELSEGYWISRYPITNGQYSEFIAAGGYDEKKYWPEAMQAGHFSDQGFQGVSLGQDEMGKLNWIKDKDHSKIPLDYGESLKLANQPVVGVSWYEALAYCRWLTGYWRERGDLPARGEIRLPTEAEWEKSARGGIGIFSDPLIRQIGQLSEVLPTDRPLTDNPLVQRLYPWGDDKANDLYMNFGEANIGSTSAVGCFPRGASPWGCEEMSGNVWEWCQSKYRGDYTQNAEDSIDASGSSRVLRGGNWLNDAQDCRSADRRRWDPDYRNDGIGFRLVFVPDVQR